MVVESTEPPWAVKKILGKRSVGTGKKRKIEYLVLWEGFPRAEASWQNEKDVRGAQEAVEEFEQREQLQEETAESEEDTQDDRESMEMEISDENNQ
jgi:hypothetical protein